MTDLAIWILFIVTTVLVFWTFLDGYIIRPTIFAILGYGTIAIMVAFVVGGF